MARQLTPKQEKFCREVIKGSNITEAFKKSYNTKNQNPDTINRSAHKVRTNPKVMARIDEANTNAFEKCGLTQEYVINGFMEVQRRCLTAVPVMTRNSEGETVESGVYTFDSAGANTALDKLAKIQSMYAPKEVKNKMVINLHMLPGDQLL